MFNKKYFFDNWWVMLFSMFCVGIYVHQKHAYQKQYRILAQQLEHENHLLYLLETQVEELQARLSSQSDPVWIEQVLKKKLGVVPEGYKKIYIKYPNEIESSELNQNLS